MSLISAEHSLVASIDKDKLFIHSVAACRYVLVGIIAVLEYGRLTSPRSRNKKFYDIKDGKKSSPGHSQGCSRISQKQDRMGYSPKGG